MVLHAQNLLISEALYPALHMLEIVVRNRVHEVLSVHAGTPEWFYKVGLTSADLKLVKEAEDKLVQHSKPQTPDNLVAALSFGFWCAILNARYEHGGQFWPALIPKLVPRAPKPLRNRRDIADLMEKARKLRNRVFHHEPIAHISDLPDRYRSLMTLIKAFSPQVHGHLKTFCRFNEVRAVVITEAPLEAVTPDDSPHETTAVT
ncbi:hypothetical protein GCM10010872_01770 [Dyella flava]|nr:hypothetical protein GCM10010872_01770 [Dyella flava]